MQFCFTLQGALFSKLKIIAYQLQLINEKFTKVPKFILGHYLPCSHISNCLPSVSIQYFFACDTAHVNFSEICKFLKFGKIFLETVISKSMIW